MKKKFQLYIIIWAIVLALFNLVAFMAGGFDNTAKYSSPDFWLGYALITLTFVVQLVCAAKALRADSLRKTFLGMSMLTTGLIGLLAAFVFGGLCMLIPLIPYWVGGIVCAMVLAFNIIALIKAQIAVDIVDAVDQKIKAQTFFIQSLTADADRVLAMSPSDEIRAECRRVYEAVRYSDPMSNEALAGVEGQITLKFAALESAVAAGDADAVKTAASELLILVKDRNGKCKLLK